MTFQQFTSCIDAQYFNKTSEKVQATVAATAVCAPLAVIPAFVSPWCLLCLIPIFAAAWLLAYCQWFLHGRLICLPDPTKPDSTGGSDQMAIGMVIDIFAPKDNTGLTKVDTDYSFGLLPAENQPGRTSETDRHDVETSVPYGFLVKGQNATNDIGLPFTGNLGGPDPNTGLTGWTLHCEFEGPGVRDLMLAAAIALQFGLAALFVCLLVPGWIGALIAFLLALLSLLGDFIGYEVAINDEASPAVENLPGSELHSGDLLVVMGAWVYDSGHNHDPTPGGFNEIHPIKFCSYIGKWDGKDWPANIQDLEAQWATALGQATSTATLESQKQPQNQWQVHPIIDGCQPSGIIV
jgi:hypothetical protein